MIRMPDTSTNLPIPATGNQSQSNERLMYHYRSRSEAQVPSPLIQEITAFIDERGGGQGLFPTPVDAVNILRSFEQRLPMRQLYRPSICVVVQGAKEIHFGEETLRYGAMECLAVGMEMPATGRIVNASPDSPYIGVTIDIDVSMLHDVLQQLDPPPTPPSGSGHCMFVSPVDEPLADCVLRLVRMARTPRSIPILYPAIMREICYWLLTGKHGGELCKLALPETNAARIVRALYLIHSDLSRSLRVEQLADEARMSPSSFHQHFKALTSMTPLQFQKQLRLIEARRLMVTEAVNVSEAAYKVGYESASQFSREYSRMFGSAPKRDVMNLQRVYSDYMGREAANA